MVKKVRNIAIGTGLTIALLAGAIILARKTNAGSTIVEGLQGFGRATGQAITAPFTGLVTGVSEGAGELGTTALKTGADAQEFLFGNRNFFGDLFGGDDNGLRLAPGKSININPNQRGVTLSTRVSQNPQLSQDLINIGVTGDPVANEFAGFGSAKAQEDALRRLIEENKRKFGSFFN